MAEQSTDPHAQTISLAEALADVKLSKGQAGQVLAALASQFRDTDPAITDAFNKGAQDLLYPESAPKDAESTSKSSTSSTSRTTTISSSGP